MTACVGNLFYLAPEVYTGDHYTESADIYSFGILDVGDRGSEVSSWRHECAGNVIVIALY